MVGEEGIASNTIVIYFGKTLVAMRYPFIVPTASFTLTSNDQVRIGGPNSFIGSISNFKIFNPGSNLLNIGISLIQFVY